MEEFLQKSKKLKTENSDESTLNSSLAALREEVKLKNNAYVNALLAH